mmetsp:Transcript_126258/g.246230  ORF Transcript_126258/g.246230 Transcript_126258/m.246230 type:complete len:280 (+) Transcript_126258:3-842(+)
MINLSTWLCALAAALGMQNSSAESAPSIFGREGAASPVPSNVAQYLLYLEAQDVYLHYYGDGQIFSLALSPALKQHLQSVASTSSKAGMPLVYGISHLSGGVCDWSKVPGWSNSSSGADAKHVFYGREIRQAPNTAYGNAIHLSLDPMADQEGWTDEELHENFLFWKAIQKDGQTVGAADRFRQFRDDIAGKLDGTFKQRWGAAVTTKAHRFALQMYTSASQNDAGNPGALFFEMFPERAPPTTEVVFFEAEDGCKGTPTPNAKDSASLMLRHLRGSPL